MSKTFIDFTFGNLILKKDNLTLKKQIVSKN